MRFSAPGAFRFTAPATNAAPIALGFKPTAEQEAILDAYRKGGPIVVEALAGSGKTTTLRLLAADDNRSGIYLAYNKAIVREAEGRFPASVRVGTAHSLAYQAIGHRYRHRLPRKGGGSRRLKAQKVAELLHVKPGDTGGSMLSPTLIVRLAQATVDQFCKTGDHAIGAAHLPEHADRLGTPQAVAELVIPVARQIWADLCDPAGRLYFTHDHYLKLWQMTGPKLPADRIFFDEAQDANPVIASVVAAQDHAQLVYVGDSNQQLYAWRGAVDAMRTVQGQRLALTKSFRFGPAIAEAANEWLDLLRCPHRVVGHDPIPSTVGPMGDALPDAVLCRTNGAALGMILDYQRAGMRVAMAPGDSTAGRDIMAFAYAALDLMAGRGTDYPELAAFTSWAELLDYVGEEEEGKDLKRMVNIVNRVGPARVIDAVKQLCPKERAQITVSTGHKAKGLEWNRVLVAQDFCPPDPDDPDERADPAELMLAYVAVTRAKLHLDPGSLDPGLWAKGMDLTWL